MSTNPNASTQQEDTPEPEKHIAPDERQRLLGEAAEQYMGGVITGSEFRSREERYRPDYRAAAAALARTRRHQKR